ncbi:hypothetical protein NDU88_009554 [Pleurodeles waltl]|uniref:Uncharacterized protein n=1 Tax=Pleurodeles waltl TaxID=8319 RepID=A0AAV7RWK5_PLEWA|nr:hypothetical protein NDU88_009554 [Pleurodeles waltl]
MVSMAAETKSIRMKIASFQTCVMGLEERVSKVEAHASSFQERDQELLFLRSKLTDLEDRSRRDNVRFIGFPENIEGEDLHGFPRLTGTIFEPPLEFQRAHGMGPGRTGTDACPRPIIACLLPHTQARQLIQKARTQGPCQLDRHTIRISADFSKDTSDRCRAFQALRLRLRQLEVKSGLFDPLRMWITKNSTSKDFHDPEELRSFWMVCLSQTLPPRPTPRHNGCRSEHYLSRPCPRRVRVCPPTSSPPAPGDGTWRDSFTATTTGDRYYMRWRSMRRRQIETKPAPS